MVYRIKTERVTIVWLLWTLAMDIVLTTIQTRTQIYFASMKCLQMLDVSKKNLVYGLDGAKTPV